MSDLLEEIKIKGKSDFNKFQRLRFFHGMLLDDKDLTAEQQHDIEKRKLHNRMLHGWGIVCGLEIKWDTCNDKRFVVKPGMALDRHGNEILVCTETTVDLSESICSSNKNQNTASSQEPCKEGETGTPEEYFIGIRYNETGTSPVPVYTPGDECGKQDCANSRTKEGFCVDILPECPEGNDSGYGYFSELLSCLEKNEEEAYSLEKLCNCLKEVICPEPEQKPKQIHCPDPCSKSPYIGLGTIKLDSDNCITEVGYERCRQHVISSYWTRYSLHGLCRILGVLLDQCSQPQESALSSQMQLMERKIEDFSRQMKTIKGQLETPKAKKSTTGKVKKE